MKEQTPMTRIVRQLRSGQITIPAEFRKQLGIDEDSFLQLTLAEGELRMRPVTIKTGQVGSPWLRELYERFAQVRDEATKFSGEEIDTAIDEAVTAVRATHAQRRL